MNLILASLNGIVAALLWHLHRHLRGVSEVAAGFMAWGTGALVIALATSSTGGILVANLIGSIGHGLLANGLISFLHQARRRWLIPFLAVYTGVVWSLALHFAPDDRSIRIIASVVVITLSFASMAVALWRDSRESRWLRWPMIGMSGMHVSFAVARALNAGLTPQPLFPQVTEFEAWFTLENGVMGSAMFLCFLAMVGARLNADLRDRNHGLSEEISRRHALEEQLSSALEMERRLHAEQRQVMHIVSHEIRTPLAGIDRAAEMLQLTPPPPMETVVRRMAGIRDSVRTMVHLIDQLLIGERASHGAIRRQPLEFESLMRIVLCGFDDGKTATRIRVPAPDKPAWWVGDQAMMIAVLKNLIENALKYSPETEPVTVAVVPAGHGLGIRVADRGIGIPETERPLIGQRFFRASNTGTTPGTGLGIFTVQRFMADQGGGLAIESGPGGVGTVVTVILPAPDCPRSTDQPVPTHA